MFRSITRVDLHWICTHMASLKSEVTNVCADLEGRLLLVLVAFLRRFKIAEYPVYRVAVYTQMKCTRKVIRNLSLGVEQIPGLQRTTQRNRSSPKTSRSVINAKVTRVVRLGSRLHCSAFESWHVSAACRSYCQLFPWGQA